MQLVVCVYFCVRVCIRQQLILHTGHTTGPNIFVQIYDRMFEDISWLQRCKIFDNYVLLTALFYTSFCIE